MCSSEFLNWIIIMNIDFSLLLNRLKGSNFSQKRLIKINLTLKGKNSKFITSKGLHSLYFRIGKSLLL